MAYILELHDICKHFGNVLANDHVNLKVEKGTVHSIVGENGAGKTTLMNILYGLYKQTSGEIIIDGKKANIESPSDAIELGIGMIHQHFKLIPAMTVAENVMLGEEPIKAKLFLDINKINESTRDLSDKYGLAVNPKSMVEDISVGIRQRVEILKALYRNANILILDEPTALLTPQESEDLFRIIERLRKDGKTILFISHKLKEIMQISDNITVLRDGKVVDTVEKSKTNEVQLARLMVGRDVFLKPAPKPKKIGEPILKVENISAVNEYHHPVLKDVSFEVRSGEVLGVAGVDGNGQTELVKALIGLQPLTHGKIILHDNEITHLSVKKMRAAGIGVIPEDRLREGLVEDFSVQENLFLGLQRIMPFSTGTMINWSAVHKNADSLVKTFDIRTPNIEHKARLLSGGNQQKIIVAREIFHAPDTIIAAQPTRGLDIAATDFVHDQLIKQRDAGKAVLLFSLSLDEIMLLSTRIAVIYKGSIVAIVNKDDVTPEDLGLMMLGGSYEHIPA
ncbi:MAG: ABC transporter ATP-binding protein [Anaerolineaceae bacterium]|jgi:simple sugar transport system ATP-binding protein|nr:MAG: ABC transporter ATP-binding protein [Anaerolineaceae bacterium]